MKAKPTLKVAAQDQDIYLIKSCSSSWLKPFTGDSQMCDPASAKTEAKCSPMSEGSDQSTSVSSSEQQTSSEDEDDSDAETCPLLSECGDKNFEDSTDAKNSDKEKLLSTMNGMDENGYQCQNFDSMASLTESTRWDQWDNNDWCSSSNDAWYAMQESLRNPRSKSQDVKNSIIKKAEPSNNNKTVVNYTFDGDTWHNSPWSCPRKSPLKSPISTSRTFEDIVNTKPIKNLTEEVPTNALSVELGMRTHININGNGMRKSETNDSSYTDITPIVNPFEKFFMDNETINCNTSSKTTTTSVSPSKIRISSSNSFQNPNLVEPLKDQFSFCKIPQPIVANSSPCRTTSTKNLNSGAKTDISPVDQNVFVNTKHGTIQNLDSKLTRSETVQSSPVDQRKLSTELSESTNKRIVTDDVNLVTRSFNNFTLSTSKQKEILRLLQERRKSREINIKSENKSYTDETKILNIQNNPLRSCYVRRRLKKVTDRQLIADGLVLEKVRYDPNWKRKNKILCTSDEVLRHFGEPLSKDVKVPSSVPTETTTSVALNGNQSCGNLNVEKEIADTTVRDRLHIPFNCAESPTDNVTPTDMSSSKNTHSNGNSSTKTMTQKTLSSETAVTKSANLSKQVFELFGDFDVYNIETTMPTIDWAAMEAHLARAAEEDDWLTRRRNDREEIRKRLALGNDEEDEEDYYCGERVARKPSLSTRLQSGMNLQICFMNETASDHESPAEDDEEEDGRSSSTSLFSSSCSSSRESSLGSVQEPLNRNGNMSNNQNSVTTKKSQTIRNLSNTAQSSEKSGTKHQRPSFFFAKQRSWRLRPRHSHEQQTIASEAAKDRGNVPTEDFYTKQARLQAEARLALAQAKEMAKMQMEVEKQKKCKKSPIADIVGLPFPDNRHHLSKQLLSDMNVAQLQVIVNDLHSQIESLNEDLVHLLLKRDDLHMEQDSMLVDIEDLTRYLGAKGENQTNQQSSGKPNTCRNK